MYLIVGLGNPEPEYSMTRHNMGFDVINSLSERYNISVNKKDFKSLYGVGTIEEKKVVLCKPQTYMNLSGEALIKIIKFYKIPIEKIIVVYDDVDTDIGKIKIRKKGSSGGHNGIKSIIENLNTEEFQRVRIGIGKPIFKEMMIGYVINKISEMSIQSLKME